MATMPATIDELDNFSEEKGYSSLTAFVNDESNIPFLKEFVKQASEHDKGVLHDITESYTLDDELGLGHLNDTGGSCG